MQKHQQMAAKENRKWKSEDPVSQCCRPGGRVCTDPHFCLSFGQFRLLSLSILHIIKTLHIIIVEVTSHLAI